MDVEAGGDAPPAPAQRPPATELLVAVLTAAGALLLVGAVATVGTAPAYTCPPTC